MADAKAKKPAGNKPKKPVEEKPKKKDKPKEVAAEAPVAEAKPAPEPRKPADPRLKYLKKFKGRFLPKGPLRDRHKILLDRWNSGEDHGGVTVEELKALFDEWKLARQKPTGAATS